MLSREDIQNILRATLSNKRYHHSLSVERIAMDLAGRYGADAEKASWAALVHDCAKDLEHDDLIKLSNYYGLDLDSYCLEEPELIHGALGAQIARDRFGIQDEEILSAVTYHTTGRENMTLLEKIIYLADLIEPGRDYPGVKAIREKAFLSLEGALLLAFQNVIGYVLSRPSVLHPRTIYAWNSLLMEWRGMEKV